MKNVYCEFKFKTSLSNIFLSLHLWCIFHQTVFGSVITNSNSLTIYEQSLQRLLQNVNGVSERPLFCSPDFMGREHVDHFKSAFDRAFSQKRLTENYLKDIHRIIRLINILTRLHRNDSVRFFQPMELKELLSSILLAQNFVLLESTNPDNNQANWTGMGQERSSLLGISVCENDNLLAHVDSNGSGNTSECNILPNNNTIMVFREMYLGEYIVYWSLTNCKMNFPHSIGITLHIRPAIKQSPLHFVFEFNLYDFRIDQCALKMHRCGTTTKCVYKQYSERVFSMDNYICQCLDAFYLGNEENGFSAPFIRTQLAQFSSTGGPVPEFHCRTCPQGCNECLQEGACPISSSLSLLRSIPLAVQSFCITVCFILGLVVFRLRRTRVIKAANWVLMEILLLGAALLYLIVVAMYFRANNITCILIHWLREVGFSIMYGVLIVKIYRVLSAFQSRKAHRVHVRNKDILKFLGIFIVTTITYMIAWTAVNLDYISSTPWNRDPNATIDFVQQGQLEIARIHEENSNWTSSGDGDVIGNGSYTQFGVDILTFDVCRSLSWDIVVELAEFTILVVSIHYCRLVRTAPSEYNETLYISIALIIELLVSAILNIVRHIIWYSVHPDYIYLLYFARSHVTVTVNLVLIFGPKVWSVYRPTSMVAGPGRPRGAQASTYSVDPNWASSGKLNMALNGDLDIVDINLADMDPEVIRRELKRLCTQIELYKTKAMRKDNPHISKRRGGRKQRRFSLQPFHKRHHEQPGSENTLLMIPTEGGYCLADCRSVGLRTCPKHGKIPVHSPNSLSSGRCLSTYTSLIHDEEASRLSEESTNSLDDSRQTVPSQGGRTRKISSQQRTGQTKDGNTRMDLPTITIKQCTNTTHEKQETK